MRSRTIVGITPGSPSSRAAGLMPSSWIIVGASSRNTGAAAVPPKRSSLSARGLVDRHQDRHLRVLGGQEPDEAGVVGLRAVRA